MDDEKQPPLVFANQLIRRLVDNLFGSDMILTSKDYMALRLVFRWCKGSWEALNLGNIVHIRLLTEIVLAWGKQPNRPKVTEFG